jgi:signal transduction histidine kinase
MLRANSLRPPTPAPSADQRQRTEMMDQRRIAAALAILTVSLVVVVTLTVRATTAAWERGAWVAQVAEPARAATEDVEAALFARMEGLEGLRATGDREYAHQTEKAVARQRTALQRLYAAGDRISPHMNAAVRRLEVSLDTAWLRAGGGAPGTPGWSEEFRAYHNAVEAAQKVEQVVVEETDRRRVRIAALEARASMGGLLMVPIAFACLWIALRCAVRLRGAAALADERRAGLERLAHENAVLVHEVTRYLTQPLGTVAGRLATLEMTAGSGLDGDGRAALTAASGELRRALQILHDLSELSTADAGTMPVRLGEVNLGALLGSTVSGLIGWASAKGVRLVLSPPPPELVLTTDLERLRGILRNLLSSAIQVATQGSIIQVDASEHTYSPDGRGGPWVAIAICETPLNGSGEAGVSTVEMLKRQVGPSGELGLTLSQRVMTLLGGSLSTYGSGAAGARFAVWLPGGAGAEDPQAMLGMVRAG